ncbi:MAG: translation elongation factor Ts [bacterium]|nr:translation elongation factor Ts [bacterium]
MAEVPAKVVKTLRDKTGVGMMDCKKALIETEGDIDKAIDLLRVQGLADAKKRSGRSVNEGVIYSYIHPGDKLGVMVEVNCETDFVARNDEFREMVKNIAMHIAASDPATVSRDDISEEMLEKERRLLKEQALESGKPENVVEKIVEGRMSKFYEENCLMEQAYVKDPDTTVREYLDASISKIGENMAVRRFARFKLGEEVE